MSAVVSINDGFSRTRQTASEAEKVAALLARVAESQRRVTFPEAERLKELAERYTAYAAALREMICSDEADAEQDDETPDMFAGSAV